jgi:alpha-mannosidase
MEYPEAELAEATRSLLTNQFHDILGGTSIPSGERTAMEELGHGLTLTSRVKARAFFALTSGQRPGKPGTHPILVFNPHPFPVRAVVECEVQPAWPDREDQFGNPVVSGPRGPLPAQAEKEESNINEDHRKRVVFTATLKAGRMNRFHCRFEKVPRMPAPAQQAKGGRFRFKTSELDVVVNARTGLLDRFRIFGKDYLAQAAACPLVMKDNADPWGMTVSSFREPAGKFKLMTRTEAARFAGVEGRQLSPVRIIEDGPVRTVLETLFGYGTSGICLRYKLPRKGTEVEMEVRVLWQERDSMLKLAFPTPWKRGSLTAQVAYGAQEMAASGNEMVSQKWHAVTSRRAARTLSVINDSTYGCDFMNGELRLSLLRAPAHAGHPTGRGPILRQDRFTPRLDQGEHLFRFWLNGGPEKDRLAALDREALAHNEEPFALSYWPSGKGRLPSPGPSLSDKAVQLTAFKRAEGGGDAIVRLFEPTGRGRRTTLTLEPFGMKHPVTMGPFEIKTLRIDPGTGRVSEVNLLGES